ncbi:penicillin-binding protein 2, partial [Streptomyces sp. NPDC051597]
MNKPLRRIAIFCGLLIMALMIRDNWLQYVRADELNAHKYNRRVQIERFAHERGNIITADGQPMTASKETSGSDYKF